MPISDLVSSGECMQRLLVTGGAGFIGSNLVRLLVSLGFQVLNLDKLTYAGNLDSLKDVESYPRYRFTKIDLLAFHEVESIVFEFEPDGILHLAAESHVDRSIDGPRAFVDTNIVGTFHLLQATRRYVEQLTSDRRETFRFLHVSTDEVYGSLGETGKFTESTPYSPHSPYSATKAASDHLARAWHDTFGLPVMVTNCSNNYGPFQFPEKLIPVVILKCLRQEPIPVYGQGLNIRDWLHVEDHCEALLAVLLRGKPGATYNIGGDNELKNIDLVNQICTLMDEFHPRPSGKLHADLITFVTDRPGHDLRYAIDSQKIRTELGWSPKQDPISGLKRTVQWYLENREWWENILSGQYQLQRLGCNEQS